MASYDLTTGEEIDERAEWVKEWKNMPEFVLEPFEYGTFIVRVKTKEDYDAFCALIGQKVNYHVGKPASIWYPEKKLENTLEVFL